MEMISKDNSEPRWRAAIKALPEVVVVVRTLLLKFRDFARFCYIGLKHATSSAVPLPDNDDILREIVLRLPPAPSSLPRASLVCKRWQRLVGDPFFVRRFHQHHHQTRPLLGYFFGDAHGPVFVPTLAPPDCIPRERFSLPRQLAADGERLFFLGCRHGLVLLLNRTRLEAVVWDPITGCWTTVAYPPEFTADNGRHCCRGTVLSTAAGTADGDDDGQLRPFEAILIRMDLVDHDRIRMSMCVYESQTGKWGRTISAVIPLSVSFFSNLPNVLVGDALCGFLGGPTGILEFDLKSHSLGIIKTPKSLDLIDRSFFQVVRTQDGELGIAILYELTMELWERKASSPDGWVLQKTLQLDNLLPVPRMNMMDGGSLSSADTGV